MNGAVLKYIFQTNVYTKKQFGGFSSPDLPLPKIRRYPTFFILNTDLAKGPGEHWCLFIAVNKRHNEFFDPYGNPPTIYDFDTALYKKVDDIVYNDKCVQGFAPTCGHHCIFFGIHRAMGYSMDHIVNKLYTENITRNDFKVFNFVKNMYGEDFANFNL
jgi:hypothetical protein